jgi:hypothetical protein
MESALDRTEADQAAARDEAHVAEAPAPALATGASPAEPSRDLKRPRPFDDIPSVVRALLTGYDEA